MQQSIGDVQTVVVNQNHDNHISDIQFEVSTFCTYGSFSSVFSFVGQAFYLILFVFGFYFFIYIIKLLNWYTGERFE